MRMDILRLPLVLRNSTMPNTKQFNPGSLVKYIGPEAVKHFCIVGKDSMGPIENFYPVHKGKVGIHIKSRFLQNGSRTGCEEVLFDETIVSLGCEYLKPLRSMQRK